MAIEYVCDDHASSAFTSRFLIARPIQFTGNPGQARRAKNRSDEELREQAFYQLHEQASWQDILEISLQEASSRTPLAHL